MRLLILSCSLVAVIEPHCHSGPQSGAGKDPPTTREGAEARTDARPPTDAATKPDPCSAAALGLGQAAALAPWQPPKGCTPRGTGTRMIRSDGELAPVLECPADLRPGLDFSQHALLSVGYTLSPAGAGVVAFDDGKVVTLVTRQRNPCPNDPMPMPMSASAWFLLPAAGERTLADAICTIESECG